MTEREAFEQWAASEDFCIHRDETEKYSDYHRATTRWAWQAWQARASLSSSGAGDAAVEPVAYVDGAALRWLAYPAREPNAYIMTSLNKGDPEGARTALCACAPIKQEMPELTSPQPK